MFPKIMVPPKSSILIGFSIINHPFWYPYFWKHPYINDPFFHAWRFGLKRPAQEIVGNTNCVSNGQTVVFQLQTTFFFWIWMQTVYYLLSGGLNSHGFFSPQNLVKNSLLLEYSDFVFSFQGGYQICNLRHFRLW